MLFWLFFQNIFKSILDRLRLISTAVDAIFARRAFPLVWVSLAFSLFVILGHTVIVLYYTDFSTKIGAETSDNLNFTLKLSVEEEALAKDELYCHLPFMLVYTLLGLILASQYHLKWSTYKVVTAIARFFMHCLFFIPWVVAEYQSRASLVTSTDKLLELTLLACTGHDCYSIILGSCSLENASLIKAAWELYVFCYYLYPAFCLWRFVIKFSFLGLCLLLTSLGSNIPIRVRSYCYFVFTSIPASAIYVFLCFTTHIVVALALESLKELTLVSYVRDNQLLWPVFWLVYGVVSLDVFWFRWKIGLRPPSYGIFGEAEQEAYELWPRFIKAVLRPYAFPTGNRKIQNRLHLMALYYPKLTSRLNGHYVDTLITLWVVRCLVDYLLQRLILAAFLSLLILYSLVIAYLKFLL